MEEDGILVKDMTQEEYEEYLESCGDDAKIVLSSICMD